MSHQIEIRKLRDLMRPNVDPVDASKDGVWFEPRSLWFVKNVNITDYAIGEGGGLGQYLTIPLQRNAFRNGSRFPFELHRIAITGVGYPLARPDVEAMQNTPTGPADLNGTCAINRVRFQIASPFRQQWTRTVAAGNGMAPLPTSTPEPAGDAAKQSSLFGLTSLMFDRPLILPRNGACEWSMSSLQGMRWTADAGGTIDTPFNLPSMDLPMTLSYLERGGLLRGSARSCRVNLRTNQSSVTPVPNPDTGYPYALPPGFVPMVGGAGNVPFWDPTATFDAALFRAKNSTRAGSSDLYGMTIAIDQTEFDTALLDSFTDATIAPMSTRVGTRVRVVGGPASDWWWRPGAPAALVFDTTTPAAVFQLDEPITLMPGDSLDVSLMVPASATFLDGGATVTQSVAESYQFGISFNGFAALNG